MTDTLSTPTPTAILCADWGKSPRKRAVYVADVSARVVRRVSATNWSFERVLREARKWSSFGPVLATFDVPLGVPESYLAAVRRALSGEPPSTFLDLLAHTRSTPEFFQVCSAANEWGVERPFFAVPAGAGALRAYVEAAARLDINLLRRIDTLTGAKPVFVKSGIPGSVGSAACALWPELVAALTPTRTYRVWPFEGDLEMLLRTSPIVVGEIYPRAAYATALLDAPPEERAPLVVAKTREDVRRSALSVLQGTRWVRECQVVVEDVTEAEANEDDFDACVTAAALLRCVLDGSPLCSPGLERVASEGGILGTGSINVQLPPQYFARPDAVRAAVPHRHRSTEPVLPPPAESNQNDALGAKPHRCPIAGCGKVFEGSRGGWDAHVGAPRRHPQWHPELQGPEERKRTFRAEFPEFFK